MRGEDAAQQLPQPQDQTPSSAAGPLRRCAGRGFTHLGDLRDPPGQQQASLDDAVACDNAALEKSTVLEIHKVTKTRKLCMRIEFYRPACTRLILGAVCASSDRPVSDGPQLGELHHDGWSPFFERHEPHEEAARLFEEHVHGGVGHATRRWPRGQLRSIAATTPPSALGPDCLRCVCSADRRHEGGSTSQRAPRLDQLCGAQRASAYRMLSALFGASRKYDQYR